MMVQTAAGMRDPRFHHKKEKKQRGVGGMETLLADRQADVLRTLLQQLFGGDITLCDVVWCHMESIRC